MQSSIRDKILARLKGGDPGSLAPRPALPVMAEAGMDHDRLVDRFVDQLSAQAGIVHRPAGPSQFQDTLDRIFKSEAVSRAMVSTDAVLSSLNLHQWAQSAGYELVHSGSYADRQAYTRAVFDEVQIGITSADYGVAESGTLILVHNADNARLLSLAPLVHLAVLPVRRIVGTYDTAMQDIFADNRRPSQVSFITGPSMTADIQGVPFKGMHGPQKLIVILLSE